MAENPYISWYTSDFLNGVADLPLEVVGAYAVLLNLMADRGGPLDDDVPALAHRCRISTRRMGQIRRQLIEEGKLEARNGVLGNAKMLREIRRRDGRSRSASKAANARWDRWRADQKPQLPLDYPQGDENFSGGKTGTKTGEEVAKLSDLNGQKNDHENHEKPQNSADQAMRTHPDSRAGANPEPESTLRPIDQESTGVGDAPSRSADPLAQPPDLVRLLEQVSASAGFVPRGAKGYADAVEQVRSWRDDGIDFEQTVLPTIERMLREGDPDDHTSSLKRFDRQIRHRHALEAAKRQDPAPPAPTPFPILTFDEETPEIAAFRQDVLQALGPRAYCQFLHPIRLEAERQPNGKHILFAFRPARSPFELLDGDRLSIIPSIAKRHGYDGVWERVRRSHESEQKGAAHG